MLCVLDDPSDGTVDILAGDVEVAEGRKGDSAAGEGFAKGGELLGKVALAAGSTVQVRGGAKDGEAAAEGPRCPGALAGAVQREADDGLDGGDDDILTVVRALTIGDDDFAGSARRAGGGPPAKAADREAAECDDYQCALRLGDGKGVLLVLRASFLLVNWRLGQCIVALALPNVRSVKLA